MASSDEERMSSAPPESPLPSKSNGVKGIFDDDDDDAPPVRELATRPAPGGDDVKDDEEDEGDLFGDEDDGTADSKPRRRLDDEDLDSGDDEDRQDRAQSRSPAPEQQREELVQYSEFGRQPVPEPSDGEMYLLKVPKFLAIEPTAFDALSFPPPAHEHHSRQLPPSTFSKFDTATTTIRWRHSPSNPDELQSNARILRWSDGSLTLQFGSDPTQQYEIDGNALAPPQKNASKPGPITNKPVPKSGGHETYTYLTVPHESVGLLRVTHKITAGLSIAPSQKTTDDALIKLQNSLAAAVRGKTAHNGSGIEIMPVVEDPELGRKKAELAEKEKARAQKRREAAENRDRERGARALGRAGLGGTRGYGGGLSVGMLEDDEEGGAGAARPKKRAGARKQRRRNDEYSSDEDMGRRKGNFAQDEYEVDDFVAGSDEEEEEPEEDDDEEEEEEDAEEERRRRKKEKRSRRDEDADGEEDEDGGSKAKRRRPVDEDEDDE